jgi:hypothetical protein
MERSLPVARIRRGLGIEVGGSEASVVVEREMAAALYATKSPCVPTPADRL